MMGVIVGLFKPSAIKLINRKQVAKYFGLGFLILFFLDAIIAPPIQKDEFAKFEKRPIKDSVTTQNTTNSSTPSDTIAVTTTLNTPLQTATSSLFEKTTTTLNANSLVTTNQLFTVVRVIDGDTIEINTGEHVRYIGIDTPETKDPRKVVQCFGKEAAAKNTELVSGKKVRFEKDITDKDKYGRLLRYVYIGDTMINLELVKTGYAKAYTYPPDVKYSNLFVEAQNVARNANLGLWGACNTVTPTKESSTISTTSPVLPPQTVNKTSDSSAQCVIKGNINATGEKIYHLPGCRSYEKTVIEPSIGERWFCTEQEATQAGWRKAGNC